VDASEFDDRDPQWFNANGEAIPEQFTINDDFAIVPVGEPRDRQGRPMMFDTHGERIFYGMIAGAAAGAAVNQMANRGYGGSSTTSSSTGSSYRRSGWSIFPWRSGSVFGSNYGGSRPPTGAGSGGSTYFGGSRPNTSSAPSSRPSTGGSVSSGGSVSRGGFGSGGSSATS
ncbi:MAG: hypothetical protein ACRCZF_19375, partial [Gemmataceae bacterium]